MRSEKLSLGQVKLLEVLGVGLKEGLNGIQGAVQISKEEKCI